MRFETGNAYGRRWKPGESGNPQGRSKLDFDLAEAARAHAPEMLHVAVAIARDERVDAGHRLKAVEIVLARGHGRPLQALAIDQRVQHVDATLIFAQALQACAVVEETPARALASAMDGNAR